MCWCVHGCGRAASNDDDQDVGPNVLKALNMAARRTPLREASVLCGEPTTRGAAQRVFNQLEAALGRRAGDRQQTAAGVGSGGSRLAGGADSTGSRELRRCARRVVWSTGTPRAFQPCRTAQSAMRAAPPCAAVWAPRDDLGRKRHLLHALYA